MKDQNLMLKIKRLQSDCNEQKQKVFFKQFYSNICMPVSRLVLPKCHNFPTIFEFYPLTKIDLMRG